MAAAIKAGGDHDCAAMSRTLESRPHPAADG